MTAGPVPCACLVASRHGGFSGGRRLRAQPGWRSQRSCCPGRPGEEPGPWGPRGGAFARVVPAKRGSRAKRASRADGHARSGWDARDCVSRMRRHGECAPCVCARVPVCARARDWDRELRGVPPLRRHLPLTACPPLRVAGSARAWRTPGHPRPTSLGVMNIYFLSIFTFGLDCVAVPQSFAVAPTTLSKLLTPCPRHLVTSAPRRLRPRFSEPRLPGSQRLPGWAEGARAAARSARPARAHTCVWAGRQEEATPPARLRPLRLADGRARTHEVLRDRWQPPFLRRREMSRRPHPGREGLARG